MIRVVSLLTEEPLPGLFPAATVIGKSCPCGPSKGPFTQTSGNGERQRRAVVPLGILRLHRSGKPRGIYANDIPQIHPKFPPNRLVCMQMTPKTMALVQWHRKHEEEALLLLILARRLRAERKRLVSTHSPRAVFWKNRSGF